MLERIRAVNEYIRRDVDGFQEEWLQCRRQDHEKNVRNDKKRVEQREEMNDGLDAFIALTEKYVDVTELTPTIVNEYIKKILVYAPDKSSGKRQ